MDSASYFLLEDTAASPNDPELMQDVEECGSHAAAAAATTSSASDVSFAGLYPSKAHGVEFKIEVQPEPQHRCALSERTTFGSRPRFAIFCISILVIFT